MKKEKEEEQAFEVYSDRVIFREIDIEFKVGSLILGEVENDRETKFGKVIAVGEGKYIDNIGLIPMKTEVGDVIIVRANAPLRFNIRGQYYWTINESNIITKYKDPQMVEKPFKTEGYELTVNNARILS